MRFNVWGNEAYSFLMDVVEYNASDINLSGMTRVGPGLKMPPKDGMMLVHWADYWKMFYMASHDKKLMDYLYHTTVVLICDALESETSEYHVPQRLGNVSEWIVSSTIHYWDLELLSQKLCPRQLSHVWWTIPTEDQLIEFVSSKRTLGDFSLSELVWLPVEYLNHAEKCVGCMMSAAQMIHACITTYCCVVGCTMDLTSHLFEFLIKSTKNMEVDLRNQDFSRFN